MSNVGGGRQSATAAAGMSLAPDDARHQPPEGAKFVQQIERPLAVRSTNQLVVPCECGEPLLHIEPRLITDATRAWSVFINGFCLRCGVQRVMYTSPTQEQSEDEAKAQLRAALDEIVNQIYGDMKALDDEGPAKVA